MNLINLQIGQEVKNYKEMCNLLGEKNHTGGSKQIQLKEWSRFFKWHNEGHRFVIEDIFNVPKEKVDGRGKSENSHVTVYGKYIEKLVLDALAQNMNNNITSVNFSKFTLLEKLAMVNLDYAQGLTNKKIMSRVLHMDKEYIKHFYNNSYSKLSQTLESALKRLSNKSLITWREAITIVYSDGVTRTTVANDSMEILVTKIEVEVMKELDCKTRRDVAIKDKWNDFTVKVCDKIREQEKDFKYYYRSYKINFNEYIIEELEELNKYLLENDDRQTTRFELNNELVKNYKENNRMRYEKYKNEIKGFGKALYPSDRIKISQDYVSNNDKLVDKFISIK